MGFHKPRLVIAALRGGAGKTLISTGLLAAYRLYHDLRLIPFKKGADYIDSGWLTRAADQPCYNLDPFLMTENEILDSFVRRSQAGHGSLIEGNRGLYDGVDIHGTFSTAELARLLKAPVILVLDATKVTRTAAAQILGCMRFDPRVRIAAVLLNRVAGSRHETVLRGAIEYYCGIPVLGIIPRQKSDLFPERHLGLVPPQESTSHANTLQFAAELLRKSVDLESLWQIAKAAERLEGPVNPLTARLKPEPAEPPLVIGVVRDAAFHFYYPENLEALEDRGAILRQISSFESCPLPPIDALYIGGGFPETHLEVLAGNSVLRASLKEEIEKGLPVYAECGGLMFLCRGILRNDSTFPMTGIFPFDAVLEKKPQGHGYTVMECVNSNPFFPEGAVIKGHEFHYSRIVGNYPAFRFVFRLLRGHGIVPGWDGICYENVLAGYSHIHATGNSDWAEAMIRNARSFRLKRVAFLPDCRAGPNLSGLAANGFT